MATAATSLGLTILLTVLWIYLPTLLAAPTDVVATATRLTVPGDLSPTITSLENYL